MKLAGWFIGIIGGVLVTLWVAVAVLSRAPLLRDKLVEGLEWKLDADVDLESFSVSNFPSLRVTGRGLRLKLKGQRAEAPLIEVRRFDVAGSILGLLRRPRRFHLVTLEGLRITIPPRSGHDKEAGKEEGATISGPILIDLLESKNAQLIIMPKDPAKRPRVFDIQALHVESLGFDRTMPFRASLTNPVPTGQIEAEGTFGPWRARDPGATSLSGHYQFNHADLGTIDGISGILASTGTFAGQLDRIDTRGTTVTPDFAIDVGGQRVPLETTFHAIVDGTNGDTYLQPVDARLMETPITAIGGVYGQKRVKGRTVKLDAQIKDGRVEDVLRLAVSASQPVMVGALSLETKLLLPPGKSKVADRLQLDGHFSIARARFTDRAVHQKLITLSRRSQGKNDTEPLDARVLSDMKGHFTLRDGVVKFQSLTFGVPGALVALAGEFNLRSERLNFVGTFAMQSTVSQAAGGGLKSILLKPIDPLFRRKHAGAVIPIKIQGTRSKPEFGIDWGRALNPR